MINISTEGMTYNESIKCRQFLIAIYGEDYVSETCFGLDPEWLKEYKYLNLSSDLAGGADYTHDSAPLIHWKQFFSSVLNPIVLVTRRTKAKQ